MTANGCFSPVWRYPRMDVPALRSCPVWYLELLLFGTGSNALLPAENLFSGSKSTRVDCVGLLQALQATISLEVCPCLLVTGQHICSRGLSQLCLALCATRCVDLIILDSCLFHVLSFHALEPVSWTAALNRLEPPNCIQLLYVCVQPQHQAFCTCCAFLALMELLRHGSDSRNAQPAQLALCLFHLM